MSMNVNDMMLFFRVDLSIYLKMHTKSNLYNDYDESKLNIFGGHNVKKFLKP